MLYRKNRIVRQDNWHYWKLFDLLNNDIQYSILNINPRNVLLQSGSIIKNHRKRLKWEIQWHQQTREDWRTQDLIQYPEQIQEYITPSTTFVLNQLLSNLNLHY